MNINIRQLSDKETMDFLRGVLASKLNNVPFIGTGFTYGEKARNESVPDGKKWMEIMRTQINKESSLIEKPSEDELKECNFQQLSDIYFRHDIVPLETIKNTLNDYFTNVNIASSIKKEFLSLNWSYLYTLNIDDAIEKVLDAITVLPYESFAKFSNRTFIYKMHGDVETALKAKDRNDMRLIFGQADYIKSLRKNEQLIETLTNDLIENNLIFIGCSLTDEIDILYAISNLETNIQKQTTKRIYVTSSTPSYTTKAKLDNYGITDIIVGDYDDFYLKYIEVSKEVNSKSLIDSTYLFRENKILFSSEMFFRYFVQFNWDKDDNSCDLSITRTIEKEILNSIDIHPIIAISGERFSGKTSILYSILNKAPTKKLFFVNSDKSLADKELSELLESNNSLIVFDTESINWLQIRDNICTKVDFLRERNTSVIIGLNSSDINDVHKLNPEAVFDIPNKFDSDEINEINKILDSVGIMRWKKNERVLDNIYHISDTIVLTRLIKGTSNLQTKIEERVKHICHHKIEWIEFSLIYFLAAYQRIFSIHYRAILRDAGYNSTGDIQIDKFIAEWQPFIEKKYSDLFSNKASHSSSFLTSNSQAWIYFAIRLVATELGVEETAKRIARTVSVVKKVNNEYRKLIMFDTLNGIFPSNTFIKKISARTLIDKIYKELAPLLSGEPDYWLQRAKSIYHYHSENNIDDVLIAIEYANKAIKEPEKRVPINARLSRANLYGLLCKIDNYDSDNYMITAINMYSESFDDYDRNHLYLNTLIERNKTTGYLKKLIDEVDVKKNKSTEFLKVKNKVDNLRNILSTQSKKR